MLVGGPGEVERQRVAVDGCLEHDLEVALARLEHVARTAGAVLELLQACARPPFGVVEHLLERLGEVLCADALVQLCQAA